MAHYISQNAYAKRLGVSPAAISYAVKEGRVNRTARGIDPDHPTNKHYEHLLNLSRFGNSTSNVDVEIEQNEIGDPDGDQVEVPGRTLPTSTLQPRQRTMQGRASHGISLTLLEQGKELDNKVKAVKLSREKIRYFEEIKKSIPASLVIRSLAMIGASLQTQFMMFDERAGESLYSLVQSGEPKEKFMAELRREINESMKAVLEVVQNSTTAMKTTTPSLSLED